VVIPPAIVVAALLPLLAAGSDPAAVDASRVANLTTWTLLLVGAAFLFLRTRKPKHL
jgi:hypothetical protein